MTHIQTDANDQIEFLYIALGSLVSIPIFYYYFIMMQLTIISMFEYLNNVL